MTYKFGLQKQKEFGTHSDICKSLRGIGIILGRILNVPYDPLGHHCYMPQVNDESHYKTVKDLLATNPFEKEGKEMIHVCINCGQVYEDLQRKSS
jgi:hypothetical protein